MISPSPPEKKNADPLSAALSVKNNDRSPTLKSNAINAGLRILEVTRVSVVLKACLSFQLFLLVFEYH